MSKLDTLFTKLRESSRKGLIPFVTCGDPEPAWTVEILHSLVAAGADAIELGMPFSDPSADGPVIEKASERAIAKGMTLAGVLGIVQEFRQKDRHTPIVLMGYLNPILQFGRREFLQAAKSAGADALLLVDCPIEESELMRPDLDELGLQQIFLVAPTSSPARRARMAAVAQGFIYYVSFAGVTGAAQLDPTLVNQAIAELKKITQVPIAVGFGVKDAATAVAISQHANAVVIGSALVARLARAANLEDAKVQARDFLLPIRQALDATP